MCTAGAPILQHQGTKFEGTFGTIAGSRQDDLSTPGNVDGAYHNRLGRLGGTCGALHGLGLIQLLLEFLDLIVLVGVLTIHSLALLECGSLVPLNEGRVGEHLAGGDHFATVACGFHFFKLGIEEVVGHLALGWGHVACAPVGTGRPDGRLILDDSAHNAHEMSSRWKMA